MRKKFVGLLCLVVLLPILPLYLIRAIAQGVVDFLDWAVEGRKWSRSWVAVTERIEIYFGTDADTEYKNWKQRMRNRSQSGSY